MTWLAVSIVLISILLINRFIKFLGDAANGDLAADMVFILLGLKALAYFSLVLPFTFFLASMLTLGRFGRDNEITVLFSCGVGPGMLYKSIALVFVPLLAIVIYLSFVVSPWAARLGDKYYFEAQKQGPFASIEPGRFIKSKGKDGFFYASDISVEKNLIDVYTSYKRLDNRVIISAKRADFQSDYEEGVKYLVFYDGYRYEGIPGKADWNITKFSKHGVKIKEKQEVYSSNDQTLKDTMDLISSENPKDVSELHWRIAMPIMLVVLTFIVLPLGKVSPREGRFGRLFVAVIIYLIYLKTLTLGRGLIEKGVFPELLGLWWVHLIFIVLGIVIYRKVFAMKSVKSVKIASEASE